MLPLSPTQGDRLRISSTSLTSSLRTSRRKAARSGEEAEQKMRGTGEWGGVPLTILTSGDHYTFVINCHGIDYGFLLGTGGKNADMTLDSNLLRKKDTESDEKYIKM